MGLKDLPEDKDALDGLFNATRWCNQNGHDDLAEEIAALYQEVGKRVGESNPDYDGPIPEDN